MPCIVSIPRRRRSSILAGAGRALLEPAIAACHCDTPSWEGTDRPEVLALHVAGPS